MNNTIHGAVLTPGPGYLATSASSLIIGTGSKTLTTQPGLAYSIGARVRVAYVIDPTQYMEGVVTAWNSNTGVMTVLVDWVGGAGTYGIWNINVAGVIGAVGLTGPTGPQGIGYTGRGAYSSGTTYAQGDEVADSGILYLSLQNANTGHTPASSMAWWMAIGVGLLDPGANGLLKRVALNTAAIAAAGVDYQSALSLVSLDYMWTRTPGGSLAIGSNTISITMPAGVVAASVNVGYVYIEGGTGTAEPAPITGWTSTTLTFTCAHTHSGAWTVSSATAGIQEAVMATGGSGRVMIPQGQHTLHAPVNIPGAYKIALRGSGHYVTFLMVDPGSAPTTSAWANPGAWISWGTGSNAGVDMGDFIMADSTGMSQTGGRMIDVINRPVGLVNNIQLLNAYDGIKPDTNSNAFYNDIFIGCSHFGLWIFSTVQSDGQYAFITVGTDGAFSQAFRIDGPTAGLNLTACGCGTSNNTTTNAGLFINQTAAGASNELSFSNCIFDGHGNSAVIQGYGTYTNNRILFSNCGFNAIYNGLAISGSISGVRSANCTFYGGTAGVSIADLKNSSFVGCAINSVTAGVSTSGTAIDTVKFDACTIGRDNQPGFAFGFGATTHTNVSIGNCDLSYSSAAFTPSLPAGIYLYGFNQGIDNVVPGATPSATSIAAPPNPMFPVSGVTTITTITGGWAGRRIRVIKLDSAGNVTIGGGGNTPGTHTLAQYGALDLVFDGSNWY